jgi:hypothetical protein
VKALGLSFLLIGLIFVPQYTGSHLYIVKESYQRVGEEMHSMKMVN